MTGPKLNEKSFVAGERSGTKARAKYIRTSASKVRVVLDLIRGLDVASARDVLEFCERDAATTVGKLLDSAIANAANNHEQNPEELFVSACFADEARTAKRFKPRARGRAGKIFKRSSHITIIVSRLPEDRLARIKAKAESAQAERRSRRTAANQARGRRARVAASQAADAGHDHDHEHEHVEPEADIIDVLEQQTPIDAAEDVVLEEESAAVEAAEEVSAGEEIVAEEPPAEEPETEGGE